MSASLTDGHLTRPATGPGRRVLAVASCGGHLKQLASLVGRIPSVGSVTWVTYDRGPSQQLLAQVAGPDDQVVFAPYAAPRDVPRLVRDAQVVRRALRQARYGFAIGTGALLRAACRTFARTMRGPRLVL